MLRFVQRNAREIDARAAAALRPYGGVTARLLYARGIETADEAERFLNPSLDQLHDPMRMHGMARAVDILTEARTRRLPTVVYGDYDVDGICACALLTMALRRFGIDAQTYTPLRAEGYGLNVDAVRRLATEYRVLVTVDLGITNHEEVRLAQSLGMRVIVTDHHGLGLEESPADAVMNPLLGDYPFRRLCGTGVAFKLAQALLGPERCQDFLDLAALATVADIVPLTDENRVLVALGLPVIAARRRPGIRALLAVSGEPSVIDSDTLGYRLGPRLNAAGRLDDAGKGVRLMMTEDTGEAERLAEELDALNTERKTAEQRLVQKAMEAAGQHDFTRGRVLIVRGEDWHVGVIGLAAGRLCTRFFCPTCVLSEHEGLLHGSLRSIPGVNIHKCLQACDDLLLRYGGHEQAAGVTLESARYDAFCERLQAAVAQADEGCFLPMQEYDAEVTLADCTPQLLSQVERLAPFGCGNPPVLLLARGLRPEQRRSVGAGGAHLKLTLRQGSAMLGGIAFGMGAEANTLAPSVDAVFSLTNNTFRGNTTLEMDVKALVPEEGAQTEALAALSAQAAQEALLRFLLDAWPQPAGKTEEETERIKVAELTALRDALSTRERGHLLISHSPASAIHALSLGRLDVFEHAPADPRGFATLLTQPLLSLASGHWRHVWLLDGEVCPMEAERWLERLPEAQVHILPRSRAVGELARGLDAGDAAYRGLYRLLRSEPFHTLAELSAISALTPAQTLAGLHAFAQLQLITLEETPFRYTLLPAQKCSLEASPLLSALRRIGGIRKG